MMPKTRKMLKIYIYYCRERIVYFLLSLVFFIAPKELGYAIAKGIRLTFPEYIDKIKKEMDV